MASRYNFQDILDRFNATQAPGFKELSDSIARRVLELLGGSAPAEPPTAPQNLEATDDLELRIDLDWDPVLGATGYNIYRSPSGTNSFSERGVSTTSDYADVGLEGDTDYEYYVTARNTAGEGPPSAVAQGTSLSGAAPPLPDVPANFTILASTDEVTLGWDALTGGTVAVVIERSNDQVSWSVVDTTTNLTFNDPNVTVGNTYFYRAYGVSASGITSVTTPVLEVLVVDGDTEAPPVPKITNTTFGNKSVRVEWDSVFASDLAGYEIGYGTTSGVYTDTTDLLQGSSANVTGLTNGTQYFFAIRSVDTSLNENKSAWSNEKFNTPFDLALPGQPPAAPQPPTALTFTSPEADTVRIGFVEGVTANPVRSRLYARVRPDQLVDGNPVSGVWAQIDQERTPATVLGKDATIFMGSYSYAQNPVVWEFYVTTVDTYSQESAPSEIVEGVLDGLQAGEGPGSGPVGGGSIPGENLTQEHQAPGYTFNYVIDVSDPAAYEGDAMERAAAIFNNRRALSPSNPDYLNLSSTERATVAVLLPNETVNRRLEINTGANSSGAIEAANFDFGGDPGFETLIDLHLIAPWPTGDLVEPTTTLLEAAEAVRDEPTDVVLGYKRTYKDANGNSLFSDGTGQNVRVGDVTKLDAKLALYMWCWDVEVSGFSGLMLGDNDATGTTVKSHDSDVIMQLCKIHQDGVSPKTEIMGVHGIDSRYTKPSMLGCFIDLPWQTGSAVRMLSPLRGQIDINRVRVRACGGSGFELRTRRSRDEGLPAGTDPGTLNFVDVRHHDEKYASEPRKHGATGRYGVTRAPFFLSGGIEQDINITNTDVVMENPSEFCAPTAWPPSDAYTNRIYSNLVKLTPQALVVTQTNSPPRLRSDGRPTGTVTVSNSLLYSKVPAGPVVDIQFAEALVMSSSGFFTAEEQEIAGYSSAGATLPLGDSVSEVRVGDAPTNLAQGPGVDNVIGACSGTLLCTTGQETFLTNTYAVGAEFIRDEATELVIGEYTMEHFGISEDFSFSDYTAPTVPYLMPRDLSPQFTVQGFAALAYVGNTTEQNKEVRAPYLQANRAPRVREGIADFKVWEDGPGTGDTLLRFGNNTFTLNFANQETLRQTGTLSPSLSVDADKNITLSDVIGTWGSTGQWTFNAYVQGGDPGVDYPSWGGPHPDFPWPQVPGRPGSLTWDNVLCDPAEQPAGSNLQFGTREHYMDDRRFVNCDFADWPDRYSHALYLSGRGDLSFDGCTILRSYAQAWKWEYRDSWHVGSGGQPVAPVVLPMDKSATISMNDTHIIDCCTAIGSGWSSFNAEVKFGCTQYPSDVLFTNSSFIAQIPEGGSYASKGASLVQPPYTRPATEFPYSQVPHQNAFLGPVTGTVATFGDLPTEPEERDLYYVTDEAVTYKWNPYWSGEPRVRSGGWVSWGSDVLPNGQAFRSLLMDNCLVDYWGNDRPLFAWRGIKDMTIKNSLIRYTPGSGWTTARIDIDNASDNTLRGTFSETFTLSNVRFEGPIELRFHKTNASGDPERVSSVDLASFPGGTEGRVITWDAQTGAILVDRAYDPDPGVDGPVPTL